MNKYDVKQLYREFMPLRSESEFSRKRNQDLEDRVNVLGCIKTKDLVQI